LKRKKVSPDTYKLNNNHGVKNNIGDNLTSPILKNLYWQFEKKCYMAKHWKHTSHKLSVFDRVTFDICTELSLFNAMIVPTLLYDMKLGVSII